MKILVVNSGSSSIKISLFEADHSGGEPRSLFDGGLTGIGDPSPNLNLAGSSSNVEADSALAAIRVIFDALAHESIPSFDAIGYRVVHPGPHLDRHQLITPEVLNQLEAAVDFAPLHDPDTIRVIREGIDRYPHLPHYACFDTVFHNTMPEEATTYPIPQSIRDQGVHRYGFHGLSCESIVWQLRNRLPPRMVIAHLGSGCSVTALVDGRSIDTTMGLTPTGGVVMGTRPGDLDPGLLLYLFRQHTNDAANEVELILNHKAGMVALSGLPNDMKTIRRAAADGNTDAILALKVFTRSVAKAIGAFTWLLGGVDAIVFTGGIGEHDPFSRAEILVGSAGLGIALDPESNNASCSTQRNIAASHSATALWILPAQEHLMIAMHVVRMAKSTHETSNVSAKGNL